MITKVKFYFLTIFKNPQEAATGSPYFANLL